MRSARAVLLVLDGLPLRRVGPQLTPTLIGLARSGGFAPRGGIAALTSATYANHASFVTGAHPGRHRLTGNFVVRNGAAVPAYDVGLDYPTLFDAAAARGLASAAVFGDQHLVAVTGACTADGHWPPHGVVPEGARTTDDGYLADAQTAPQVVEVLASDADLIIAQLNNPDSAGHAYGPDSDEAGAAYHSTDAWLATIVEAMEPRWHETFLAVVSDHDQVTVTDFDCIDLWSPARAAGLDVVVIPEGDAAFISGDRTDGRWLDAVPGLGGHEPWYDGLRLAWCEPGRVFGWGECTLRGIHGSPAAATQVAVVAGGHPLVAEAAAVLGVRRPRAEDWAPTIAAVLGLDLPVATGRSLVAP